MQSVAARVHCRANCTRPAPPAVRGWGKTPAGRAYSSENGRSGSGYPRCGHAAGAGGSKIRSGDRTGRAGSALRRLRLEVAVGGRDDPQVDLAPRGGAHGAEFALLDQTQELDLHLERQVADSSKKKAVPPSAAIDQSLLVFDGVVNAPLTWPKSSLSMSVPTSDPQSMVTNWPVGVSLVYGTGYYLLTRATLPREQDREAIAGSFFDQAANTIDQWRLADEAVSHAVSSRTTKAFLSRFPVESGLASTKAASSVGSAPPERAKGRDCPAGAPVGPLPYRSSISARCRSALARSRKAPTCNPVKGGGGGGGGRGRGADDFQADASGSRADQVDGAGGGGGEVDDAAPDEGAAVGDSHLHLLVVAQVFDEHPGIERQGAMGRGQLLHVVDFAVCGQAAVVGVAVPACDAGLSGCRWVPARPGDGGPRRAARGREPRALGRHPVRQTATSSRGRRVFMPWVDYGMRILSANYAPDKSPDYTLPIERV